MTDKLDKQGNILQIGDKVAYAISLGTDLCIGRITKFTDKLVYIHSISSTYTAQRYASKLVKL